MNSEIFEEFNHIISTIIKREILVIVEGNRDLKALNDLGIKHVITLNRKPIYQIAENVALQNKEVIILTDLDSEGKYLYSKLNKYLNSLGVRIDNRLRNFLLKNTTLRQIEGINSYMNRFYSKNIKLNNKSNLKNET